MKIILIGFMGAGKTSVTKALSTLLRLPVLEMDELVCQKSHAKNMHEVFDKGGELLLREMEILIAKEYAAAENLIISTGAGVVMNKIVLDYLKHQNGRIFYLKADFQKLTERLVNDSTRPLFRDADQAKLLYNHRLPLYFNYSDHVVEVADKTVEELAQEIADTVQQELKHGK